MPHRAFPKWPPRVVIAIDIDCFYVACERLLKPSLIGKAVGIQQKTILATCSYEARAFGVGKLQKIEDAKKACPHLVIVNGEDLTHYRRYSRAITRLVKSIVWERRVERLGMDELFCDVTEMVHAHLEDLRSAPSEEDRIYFNLADPKSDEPKGFHYLRSVPPSLVIPGTSASQEAQHASELLAGAHLASYIRAQILEKQHFTTSAGIAHNKLIAKLVGNLNKPNLQTTWNPDVRTWKEEQTQFLAPFEARNLQGFGYAIAKTVQNSLRERAISGLDQQKLTCQMIRDNLDEKAFTSLFGAKLGLRLWSILHGNDEEPVNPSPEYPLQISVEDSHYGITSFTEAVAAMHKLCLHLLQRLKEDLTEDMNGDALAPSITTGTAGVHKEVTYWARYPTSLRLSIRQGYDGFSRQSVSTTFPVDALDEDASAEERSRKLTQNLLTSLLKKLLGSHGASGQCRITIINICATNFTKSRPDRTIASAFAKAVNDNKRGGKGRQADSALIQLSSDDEECTERVKQEFANTFEDTDVENIKPVAGAKDEKSDENGRAPMTLSKHDDLVFIGEERPKVITCKECGSMLFAFSAHVHAKFHEEHVSRTKKRKDTPIEQGLLKKANTR